MEKVMEKIMKSNFKRKQKITKALMIAFLINGGFSLAENNPITPGTNLGGDNATAIGAGSVSAGSESSSIGTNTFASGNNMTKEEYLKFLKDNKERLSKIEKKMQEIKNDKDEIQKLRQEHDNIIDKLDRINNYKKTIEDKEKELNEKEPQLLKTIEEKRTEAIKFTKEIEDLEKRIDIISQLDFSKIDENNKAQGVEILAKDLKQKMEEGQTWLKQYGENGIPLEEYKNAVLNYIDSEKKENIANRMDKIKDNYKNEDNYINFLEKKKYMFESRYVTSSKLGKIFTFNGNNRWEVGINNKGELYNYMSPAHTYDEPEKLFKLTKEYVMSLNSKSLDDMFATSYPYDWDTKITWDNKARDEYKEIIEDETKPIPDKFNVNTIKIVRQYFKEAGDLRKNIYKIKESNTTDELELLKLEKYKSELDKINKKYIKNGYGYIFAMYDYGFYTGDQYSINVGNVYSEQYIENLIKEVRNEFPEKIGNSDELLELFEKYNQGVPNSNLTKVYQDEIDRLKGLEQDANTFITEKEELIKGYKNDIENLKSLLNSENPSDVEEVNKKIKEKEEKIKKALADIENLKKNLTEIKPGTNALAYGTNSAALGKDSIAFGTNNIAIKESSIAFGTNNFVNGDKSIALGYGHKIIGDKSVALGDPNLIYGDNNFAIGNNIKIGTETQKVNNNLVFGSDVTIDGINNAIVFGNESKAIEGAVSFGNDKTTRKLKYIAKGIDDTDAVNFSQLKDYVRQNLVNVQGADTNITNLLKNKVDKTEYNTEINNINNKITDGLKTKLDKDGSNLDKTSLDKLTNKLSGESDISKPNNRLVTDTKVKQYLDTNFKIQNYVVAKEVLDIKKDAAEASAKAGLALGGVANAIAMANLTTTESGIANLTAAYGTYGKEHALAIGFNGTIPNKRFNYKLGLSTNMKGNFGIGAGIGIVLGKIDTQINKNINSKEIEQNKKIKDLEEKLKYMTDKLNNLTNKINNINFNENKKVETKPTKEETISTKLVIDDFDFDSYTLKEEQKQKLDKFFENNNCKEIVIVGYTDNVGTDDYNLKLSEKRAKEVEKYLKMKKDNLEILTLGMGKGESLLKESKNDRRVEIFIQ